MSKMFRRGLISGAAALAAYGALPKGARAAASLPPGLSLATVRGNLLRPSFVRNWVPMGLRTQAIGGTTISTLSSQWGLECAFDTVRLIYGNQTTSGYTISKAVVGASSAIGNGVDPVNAAGSTDFTLFQTVYFNNGGLDVSPQDQTLFGSGTSSFTVPAGNVTTPSVYFSDWMRVPCLTRTDGGTRSLLMCRSLTDATGTFAAAFQNNYSLWPALTPNMTLSAYNGGINSVTTPASMVGAPRSTALAPIGIQYISRRNGASVLIVGDSLTQGLSSSTSQGSWGVLSCYALSTPNFPVSCWNQGWLSQTSPNFYINGYTTFKACKPDVVTIPVWSPNDGFTQATADASFARAMDFANYAEKNNCVPVLMGPVPWSGITTVAQDNYRLSTRTRMLDAAQNAGIYALDWESVLGTGASPNVIQPALVSASHPNDAGNALMDTQVFRPVLRQILGL